MFTGLVDLNSIADIEEFVILFTAHPERFPRLVYGSGLHISLLSHLCMRTDVSRAERVLNIVNNNIDPDQDIHDILANMPQSDGRFTRNGEDLLLSIGELRPIYYLKDLTMRLYNNTNYIHGYLRYNFTDCLEQRFQAIGDGPAEGLKYWDGHDAVFARKIFQTRFD